MTCSQQGKRAIQREIRALEEYMTAPGTSEGGLMQANAMVLALQWALGKWGMPFSDWLKACDKSSKKIKSNKPR